MEETNLLQFTRNEKKFVAKQNVFLNRYEEARFTINGLNKGSLGIEVVFRKPLEVLEDILYLAEKCNERISNPRNYQQIRSLYVKTKLQKHFTSDSKAIQTIQRINKGEMVEIHLLSYLDLQDIFDVLWGNLGIKISEDKKSVYLELKDRLLRFRTAKLRSPA